MLKFRGIITGLLVCTLSLNAQFFEYGQDPQSIKWSQIKTDHFKLIFPTDFSPNGNKLANMLEKNILVNYDSFKQPFRIPVIIHNQTVNSNAFVGLAPRRMEFFSYPDPDLYGMDWLTELTLHEFQHAAQINKLNNSTTRILSYLSGEQGVGLVAAMLPFWFLEGDAVNTETMYSNAGRGRLPSFEMGIKTHLLTSKRPYSYEKSYLGSYRDFVPDYYEYGFQMTSFGRKTYGENYWPDAIDYIAKYPFLVAPLYFYSKSRTGKGVKGLYFNTMEYLNQHWSKTLTDRTTEDIQALNSRKNKTYTSYTQPKFLNDSTIICLKTGLNIIPAFVRVDTNGNEKKIFTPGVLNSGKISIKNSKIIWDEVYFDPRWRNRSYSNLKVYDLNSRKVQKITKRNRFSMPEFSPTGDTVAAIESTPEYKFFLVLLSSSDNKIISRIPSPDNASLQDPVWIDGSNNIAVIAVNNKGKRILSYNLNNQNWSEIFNSAYFNISKLRSTGHFLYFSAGFDGIDNIYSYDLRDNTLSKLTLSKFGAFYPDISNDNSKLVYSDYSKSGYDLKIKNIQPETTESFIIPDTITEQSFYSVSKHNKIPGFEYVGNDSLYKSVRYHKIANLFKIHSWSPFYFDYNNPEIDDPMVSPGITLLSQNHLGTAISTLAYEHGKSSDFIHLNYTFKGFYPVFEISSVYGKRPIYYQPDTLNHLKESIFNFSLLTYLPLNFSTGRSKTGIQPSLKLTHNSSLFLSRRHDVIFAEPGFYFYTYRRPSIRDLQPRIGFTLNLKNIFAPFEDNYSSNKSIQMTGYFPGLKTHGIKLRLEHQSQPSDQYIFGNLINPPRGYSDIPTALRLTKYTAEYVLPLFYPDLNIGPILYIKRIRATLFNDYMIGYKLYYPDFPLIEKTFFSQGFDLYADYHVFRFIFEFSTGVRLSYLPNEKKINSQLLFTINMDKF